MWNISSTDFKGASLLQTIILANHPATLKYSLSWVEDRHKLTVFYLNIIATGSMQFRNVRDVLKEEYTNILPVSWICSPPGSRAQTVFNLLLHGPVEISLEMTIKALHLPFVCPLINIVHALLPHGIGTEIFQNGDQMGTSFSVKWGPNGDLRQQKWGPSDQMGTKWGPKERIFDKLTETC